MKRKSILLFLVSILTGSLMTANSFSPDVFATAPDNTTPSIPNFPSCPLPGDGDVAHYETGIHQIVGGSLMQGADDVYNVGNGNYVQCFCPPSGDGIQTNWYRTENDVPDWYHENGTQWNLGNYQYSAQNIAYNCSEPTPTNVPEPTPTPTNVPEVTPTPTPTIPTEGENPTPTQGAQETPAPTPTNGTSVTTGGGVGGGQSYSCPDPKPGTPELIAVDRTSGTTMHLVWTPVEHATGYAISYDIRSGSYIYGVSNTGNVTEYTIGDLDPNQIYVAAVRALNGCAPGDLSSDTSTTGFGIGGGDVLGATTLASTGSTNDSLAWYAIAIGAILLAVSIYGSRLEKQKAFTV